MSKLKSCLEQFQGTINNSEKVKNLFKNWNPNILIQDTTNDDQYTLLIRDQIVNEVLKGEHHAEHEIVIEAEEDVLLDVFSGTANPSEAVLDGLMAVYGSDADQIKLDAITLVIWGM